MAVKSKEQINQRNASTDKGFGSVDRPAGEECDRTPHTFTTASEPQPPTLDADETSATMALATLEHGAGAVAGTDYMIGEAVGKVAEMSSQLALQSAQRDYFVLSGAHYVNEYRRNLAALAKAETEFKREFNFQRYLDRAIEQRAQLPSASRQIAELNLLPED